MTQFFFRLTLFVIDWLSNNNTILKQPQMIGNTQSTKGQNLAIIMWKDQAEMTHVKMPRGGGGAKLPVTVFLREIKNIYRENNSPT